MSWLAGSLVTASIVFRLYRRICVGRHTRCSVTGHERVTGCYVSDTKRLNTTRVTWRCVIGEPPRAAGTAVAVTVALSTVCPRMPCGLRWKHLVKVDLHVVVLLGSLGLRVLQ